MDVHGYPATVFELLRDTAVAGRAGFGMRDGKFSIVRDVAQTVPIQHFTPRNTMGFRGIKAFTQIPHGLKCRFVNPDRDWQQDEVIVYADGYSETNASRFETLELFGCISADLAWKHGRYHLAVGKAPARDLRDFRRHRPPGVHGGGPGQGQP
jgi:hypothetical protein